MSERILILISFISMAVSFGISFPKKAVAQVFSDSASTWIRGTLSAAIGQSRESYRYEKSQTVEKIYRDFIGLELTSIMFSRVSGFAQLSYHPKIAFKKEDCSGSGYGAGGGINYRVFSGTSSHLVAFGLVNGAEEILQCRGSKVENESNELHYYGGLGFLYDSEEWLTFFTNLRFLFASSGKKTLEGKTLDSFALENRVTPSLGIKSRTEDVIFRAEIAPYGDKIGLIALGMVF